MRMEEMIIKDCKLLVDKNTTADNVSEWNAPCDCASCRNYSKAIQSVPAVTDFLNLFGINVNRPEECMEIDTDFKTKTISYSVWYSVIGKTEQSIKIQLSADATAEILPPDIGFPPNNELNGNYFWISLDIRLPWELDEDIGQLRIPWDAKEADSPRKANQ